MEKRKPEEVKQIALDLFKCLIFATHHLRDMKDLPMVFMPIAMLGKKESLKMSKDPPGMIFEYLDKAGPRSINGYPCFFSSQMLSVEDTKKVIEIYKELVKTTDKTLEEVS